LSNTFDKDDKKAARGIYSNHRKAKDGITTNKPDIIRRIHTAADEEWDEEVTDLPEDEIVRPWSDSWGPEPAKIRTLSVLFDFASDIWEREKVDDQMMASEFPGFPKSVCDWAWKLSAFFDLTIRRDCFALLDRAYDFASLERQARSFDEPLPIRSENYDMLMRWNKGHENPDLTNRIRENKGGVSIPIWEQATEGDMEWIIASKLKGEPLVMSAKYSGRKVPALEVVQPEDLTRIVSEIQEPESGSDTEGPSDRGSEEILAEFLAKGYEIDESHAGLGIVYTNREEKEDD
jgi:hypothetical protein